MDIKYGILPPFYLPREIFELLERFATMVVLIGNATLLCQSMVWMVKWLQIKVPCFTLVGGIWQASFTGMLIVWFMNAYDYPLIVGGKPYFSPIFPFPVFYELTILFAAFGTLFGMFFLNVYPDTIIQYLSTRVLAGQVMTSS